MTIPYEIGQKVYVTMYDEVRELTITKIVIEEGHPIRLVTGYDALYPEDIFLNIHDAYKALRDRICNQFQARLERIDQEEQTYLNSK